MTSFLINKINIPLSGINPEYLNRLSEDCLRYLSEFYPSDKYTGKEYLTFERKLMVPRFKKIGFSYLVTKECRFFPLNVKKPTKKNLAKLQIVLFIIFL